MQTAGVIFSVLGGLLEAGGLLTVALQIRADRMRASELLSVERVYRRPRREYPADLPVRRSGPTPGEYSQFSRPLGQKLDPVSVRHEAEQGLSALANIITAERRAVDEERDNLEAKLLQEIDAGDEQLREGFREILAGDLWMRRAGVIALGLGILFATTGSVLGSLS